MTYAILVLVERQKKNCFFGGSGHEDTGNCVDLDWLGHSHIPVVLVSNRNKYLPSMLCHLSILAYFHDFRNWL